MACFSPLPLKMAATPTVSHQWTNFSLDIYKEGRPPLLGTVDIKEIEDKAREAMKDDIRESMSFIDESCTASDTCWSAAYMYTFGSAGTRSTDLANRNAFENYKLVPRILVDVTNRSIEVSVLLATLVMASKGGPSLGPSSRQPFSGSNIHHRSLLPRLVCKAFYILMVNSLQLEQPVVLVSRTS